jgi:hypothetical protein
VLQSFFRGSWNSEGWKAGQKKQRANLHKFSRRNMAIFVMEWARGVPKGLNGL